MIYADAAIFITKSGRPTVVHSPSTNGFPPPLGRVVGKALFGKLAACVFILLFLSWSQR
jgi:hypothetical protein